MAFFSVIIPVYNVAPYLRECLDSVLAQTFTGWEAICVDDGSVDGSGAILDEYAAKDNRFKVIHQPNAGVAVARNKALDIAKGMYVAFLDADDFVLPNWLANIHAATEQYQLVDWIRTWHQYLYSNGDRKIANASNFTYEKLGFSDDKRGIAKDAWWRFTQKGMLCINIYRAACIKNVRFNTLLAKREDTCFSAEALRNVSTFVCIDDTSYIYRQQAGSASRVPQPFKDLFEASKIMNKLWHETCNDRLALTANIVKNFRIVFNSGTKIRKEEFGAFRKFIVDSWKGKGYSFGYFNFFARVKWIVFVFLRWNAIFSISVYVCRIMRAMRI